MGIKAFYPGLNRVLVSVKELPATDDLIVSSSKPYGYGEIVAVGAIKDKEAIDETMFQKGDNVYFLSQAGLNMELPYGDLRLLAITDILVGEKE